MIAARVLSPFVAIAGIALLASGAPLACASAQSRPLAAPLSPIALAPSASSSSEPAASAEPKPEPPKPMRFAVATENATASKVAMDVLKRGGSAVDAAIAAVLTMGIVQPVSSGLGGGGFALVWDAKAKKLSALDFRETAPTGILQRDYATRSGELSAKKRGLMVGVPGEAAGIAELHKRWGKIAFADDVRAAERIADEGFAVSPHMARALAWNDRWLEAAHELYPFFRPEGRLLAAGAIAKNPALAATLRRFASEGATTFYEGAIATDIVETARSGGSRMTGEDLKRYRAVDRAPVSVTWEGYEVATMPPPSGGGLLVLETLRMHTKADLAALGYATGSYDHLLAETFRGAIADRIRAVGDPAFVRTDVMKLADGARMKARRAQISLDATTQPEKFGIAESGTSHVVIADADGNVVSITTTVNDMFGAKLAVRGGFVLNDELADFTDPKIEAHFGVPRGPNSARGGARPASSMTPVLVFKDGVPILALGGSGGLKIATGVAQVLLSRLAFARPIDLAVADPRIDTPPTGGLSADPSTPDDVVADLRKRGEIIDTTKPNYSAIEAVSIEDEGGRRTLHAAADPRKGGAALVE